MYNSQGGPVGVFVDAVIQISSTGSSVEHNILLDSLDVFEFLNVSSAQTTIHLYRLFLSHVILYGNWDSMRNGQLVDFTFSDIIRCSDQFARSLLLNRRIIDESNRYQDRFIRVYMNIALRVVVSPGTCVLDLLFKDKPEGDEKNSEVTTFMTRSKLSLDPYNDKILNSISFRGHSTS